MGFQQERYSTRYVPVSMCVLIWVITGAVSYKISKFMSILKTSSPL